MLNLGQCHSSFWQAEHLIFKEMFSQILETAQYGTLEQHRHQHLFQTTLSVNSFPCTFKETLLGYLLLPFTAPHPSNLSTPILLQ